MKEGNRNTSSHKDGVGEGLGITPRVTLKANNGKYDYLWKDN